MRDQDATPKPNEPCWCGSGRKYKQCHRAIDNAPAEKAYGESQRIYAKNWRLTADAQYARGDYHWMARQIPTSHNSRILDIGCGSGHGIRAIIDVLGSDLKIVAIDENPSCLLETRETLRQAGMGTHEITRRVETVAGYAGFRSVVSSEPLAFHEPISLVEGDVCSDELLKTSLTTSGPFDVVTVWLSGVHMLRQNNEVVQKAGIRSDQHHRLFVQNAVYELADSVLRSGGVLQVVDRAEEPSSKFLQADLIDSHKEQASPTSLEFKALTYTPWTPLKENRVPLVATPGTSGRTPGNRLSLVSVISVKP